MRAAVIQLNSQADVADNLRRIGALVAEAAGAGATLIGLPENFAFLGEENAKREIAESTEDDTAGPITRSMRELAKKHGIWLVAGGMAEATKDPLRPYNTSLLVAPDGHVAARYRKIHLFDIDLPTARHLESGATTPGEDVVVAPLGSVDASHVSLGMTICYDLRFPELYRKLVAAGVRIISVPAAFTLTTGKDHWHVLLRARAIENQVFVLAPAQHGKHAKDRMTYGKSLIVDPWGDVLAQAPEGEGFALANLDFAAQDRVRAGLPCLTHRRLQG